jgi:hypothetical protein
MAAKRKDENKPQRLAKGLPANQKHARARRARKNPIRPVRRRHTGRALANERELSPLARLMGALSAEKIRFQVIGMSAANLQGVPGSTVDVDLWLDLSSRSYMRPVNLAIGQGAQRVRNTVVEISDGTLVNFVYEVTGLPKFKDVFSQAEWMNWQGVRVAVLPLKLIEKSKRAIGRPKDLLHLELIRQRFEVKKRGGR